MVSVSAALLGALIWRWQDDVSSSRKARETRTHTHDRVRCVLQLSGRRAPSCGALGAWGCGACVGQRVRSGVVPYRYWSVLSVCVCVCVYARSVTLVVRTYVCRTVCVRCVCLVGGGGQDQDHEEMTVLLLLLALSAVWVLAFYLVLHHNSAAPMMS